MDFLVGFSKKVVTVTDPIPAIYTVPILKRGQHWLAALE